VGIFSGFIETVELRSETVEILWAIYTLPTTSDVNNSQQTTLHLGKLHNCFETPYFIFKPEMCHAVV